MSSFLLTSMRCSNLLGYFSSLGLLRVLDQDAGWDASIKWVLNWKGDPMASRTPVLQVSQEVEKEDVAEKVFEVLDERSKDEYRFGFKEDDKEKVPWDRKRVRKVYQSLEKEWRKELFRAIMWEIEYPDDVDSRAKQGPFHMLNSGRQYLPKLLGAIHEDTSEDDIQKALFKDWKRKDKGKLHRRSKMDPTIFYREAVQTRDKLTERGAERLTIEGLRLFPFYPQKWSSSPFRIPGCRSERTPYDCLTYPVSENPVGVKELETLFHRPELHKENPDLKKMKKLGVHLYRTRRRSGKGDSAKRWHEAYEMVT